MDRPAKIQVIKATIVARGMAPARRNANTVKRTSAITSTRISYTFRPPFSSVFSCKNLLTFSTSTDRACSAPSEQRPVPGLPGKLPPFCPRIEKNLAAKYCLTLEVNRIPTSAAPGARPGANCPQFPSLQPVPGFQVLQVSDRWGGKQRKARRAAFDLFLNQIPGAEFAKTAGGGFFQGRVKSESRFNSKSYCLVGGTARML